jgi:hypothetical protein
MSELTIVPIRTRGSVSINRRFMNRLGKALKEVFCFNKYTILHETEIAGANVPEELPATPFKSPFYRRLVDLFFAKERFIGDRILGVSIDPELYRLLSSDKAEIEEDIGFELPDVTDIPVPYLRIESPVPGNFCWWPIVSVIAQDMESAQDIYPTAVHTLNHTYNGICLDRACAGRCLTYMEDNIQTLCSACRLNIELYQAMLGDIKIPEVFLDHFAKYGLVEERHTIKTATGDRNAE